MPANRLPLRTLPFFFRESTNARFPWGKCVWQVNNLTLSRFTIVIPKTALKSSVHRNRLKRQLRAQLELYSPTPSIDAAIIIHQSLPVEQIVADLHKFLSQ